MKQEMFLMILVMMNNESIVTLFEISWQGMGEGKIPRRSGTNYIIIESRSSGSAKCTPKANFQAQDLLLNLSWDTNLPHEIPFSMQLSREEAR